MGKGGGLSKKRLVVREGASRRMALAARHVSGLQKKRALRAYASQRVQGDQA